MARRKFVSLSHSDHRPVQHSALPQFCAEKLVGEGVVNDTKGYLSVLAVSNGDGRLNVTMRSSRYRRSGQQSKPAPQIPKPAATQEKTSLRTGAGAPQSAAQSLVRISWSALMSALVTSSFPPYNRVQDQPARARSKSAHRLHALSFVQNS